MEANQEFEIKNKMLELKDEIKKYRESTEDGVEKRRRLARMQIDMGRYARRLYTVLKEEGYTTLEIAYKMGIPVVLVRKLEGE